MIGWVVADAYALADSVEHRRRLADSNDLQQKSGLSYERGLVCTYGG